MAYLKEHIRGAVYVFTALLAACIYLWVSATQTGQLRLIRLEEYYGFLAAFYLLLALLPTPLYNVFPEFPGKPTFTRARRAIGISTFCLSFLHGSISFFGLLAGFSGWAFLTDSYRISLALSFIALFILFLLAATSFDRAVAFMGPWWKRLHRFVYAAGLLVLVHIAVLGAHFGDPSRLVPSITYILVAVFLMLEAARVDIMLAQGKWGYRGRFSGFLIICVILIVLGYTLLTGHGGMSHAGH